ncbi:MAG: hypothetical protein KA981_00485 [Bacteroidia bacterium]|jgi:tetratricopeptide (TPR) repeat protein|nr:hypothetical protein [Bacteroidia bacterium]
MRKLIFVILFFGLNQSALKAQELTYYLVDSLSYEYLNNLDYKALSKLGKQALSKNIDFYYLRVRLGISFYKQSNFEAASPHFLKAIEMNPSEDYVLNYAYKCLLQTAQFKRANMLLIKYPQIESQIAPRYKGLSSFEFEGGAIITNNEDSFLDKTIETNGNYAAGNFFSGMEFLRGYAEYMVEPDVQIHIGGNVYQSTQLSKLQYFQSNTEQYYSTLNFQTNIGISKIFNKGYSTGFGMAYYFQNFKHPYVVSAVGVTPPNYPIKDTSELSHNISFSGYLSKRSQYIEPILFLNYANFDLKSRVQIEAGLSYFPLGNSKYYGYTSASFSKVKSDKNFVFQQKLGYTPSQYIGLDASFMIGDLDNYMSHLGFLTLNTFDPLKWSVGMDVSFRKNRYTLAPGYRYQQRESSFSSESAPGTSKTNTYTYFNHLFFITIKCQL